MKTAKDNTFGKIGKLALFGCTASMVAISHMSTAHTRELFGGTAARAAEIQSDIDSLLFFFGFMLVTAALSFVMETIERVKA